MAVSPYSPVLSFKLESQDNGVLTGYAAPRSDGRTCALVLSADDRPIVHVRASRFSSSAEAAGLRGGWCGFEVPGLAQAFAVGDTVRLSCSVSGEVQAEIAFDETLFSTRPKAAVGLLPQDVLALAREDEMAGRIEDILPIAVFHFERHGAKAFLDAACLTLLRRGPEPEDLFEADVELSLEEQIFDHLLALAERDESISIWHGQIPGPFHASFHFDRTGLIPG